MQEIPISNKIPELDFALEAAMLASEAILQIYDEKIEEFTKDDNSPITKADLKSNELIKKILSKTEHHILSEEDKDDLNRLQKDTLWIVDPLDGTSDFIDKTGEFTVMISLVKNKIPVLGVIAWPTEKIIFAAQKNQGAFQLKDGNWEKISVSNESDIKKCRAVGSRHHLSDKEKNFIKLLEIKEFSSIGSSLKVCMIASGKADAYITTTNKMKEWDSAASNCIILEAGGLMTDMSGNQITYNNEDVFHQNGIIVSNGKIHEKIVCEYKKLD